MSEINVNDFFRRGVKLIGSTLRSRRSEMKADILAKLEAEFWPSLASGKMKVVIHQTLPITSAEAAHAVLQNRENIGKVVMTVKS